MTYDKAMSITAREFMIGYAQRSKATPEELFAEGCVVATCTRCDYEGCEGWQMTTLPILERYPSADALALDAEGWAAGE